MQAYQDISSFRNAARRDASALKNVKLFLREPLGRIGVEIEIVVDPVQRRQAFQCLFCSSARFLFDPDFDSDFDLDGIYLSFIENCIKEKRPDPSTIYQIITAVSPLCQAK